MPLRPACDGPRCPPPGRRWGRPHLSRKGPVLGGVDVRRVADDEVHRAPPRGRHSAEQVALPDHHVEAEAGGIVPGEVDRLCGPVDGDDLGAGDQVLDGQRHGSGARSHVHHPRLLVVGEGLEGGLDQNLGLRPGDEHPRPDLQVEPEERLSPREVLERGSTSAGTEGPGVGPGHVRLDPPRRVEGGAVRPGQVGEQGLGLGAGAVDAMPGEVGLSAPDQPGRGQPGRLVGGPVSARHGGPRRAGRRAGGDAPRPGGRR